MSLLDNIKKIRSKENASSYSAILASTYNKANRRFISSGDASSYMAKNMSKFYITSSKFSKGVQIKNLLRKVEIDIPSEGFIYFLDEFKNLDYSGQIINTPVDYSLVLKYSIYDLNEFFFNTKEGPGFKNISSDYNKEMLAILDGVELLIYEINKKLARSSRDDKSKFIRIFEDMIDGQVLHFEEGLQRILFLNQLLWQTGHGLNSLGRLDKILEDLYYADLENGFITNREAYHLIKEFLKTLNSYSWFKTDDLADIASQTITLGGKYVDDFGEYYFCNDLTYMFLEAIGELDLKDVKMALRLSYKTPDDLIKLALDSLNENVVYIEEGVKLESIKENMIYTDDGQKVEANIDSNIVFSNDEVVIPKLIGFGYGADDAYNYVLSSHLEPTFISCLDENNISSISLLKPLNDIFESKDEIRFINSLDYLMELYKANLKKEIEEKIKYLDSIEWNRDPLLSLFSMESYENQLDISEGGTRYNNYGIRFYALSNTVNSLYNLKKIVFEDKVIELSEIDKMRKNNFKRKKYQEAYLLLKNNPNKFGMDNKEMIDISNDIISFIDESIKGYKNKFEGKLKFGFSSPKYMVENYKQASFDGYLKDDIPSRLLLSSQNADVEIFDFASKLDFKDSGFNGNLIELNIKSDEKKLTNILVEAIGIGFYQLQINLIREEVVAKENIEE
ncbi:MAG: hypothetical protein IKV87_02440 [Methanobrevibacter sp.]|nr:hypothetical protein [Methanobrevibacter sp.]